MRSWALKWRTSQIISLAKKTLSDEYSDGTLTPLTDSILACLLGETQPEAEGKRAMGDSYK